jgi:hypothetical protein
MKKDNRISDLSIISLFFMWKYSEDLSLSMGRWFSDRNKTLHHSRSFASFCGGYFSVCERYLFNSFGYWFVPAAAIIINALSNYAYNSCKTFNDITKFYRKVKYKLKYLCKVKLSLYRTWRPLWLREVEAPTFTDIRLTDGGKVVRPRPRPHNSSRKIPGTYFS